MRTFSCVTSEWGFEAQTSFIIAQDERRACELARRELLSSRRRPAALRLLEGGKLLWEGTIDEG
jgi:hypothetical protein